MKDLMLKLEDEDYGRLQWLANKLELSVNQCLRILIPKVELPDCKVVADESEIASANPGDLVPIRKLDKHDLTELEKVLVELNNKNWGVTLANEIRRQIIDKKSPDKYLTVKTCKRLSRWVHPYRWSERERYVQPRAKRISEILFGRVIDRVD